MTRSGGAKCRDDTRSVDEALERLQELDFFASDGTIVVRGGGLGEHAGARDAGRGRVAGPALAPGGETRSPERRHAARP